MNKNIQVIKDIIADSANELKSMRGEISYYGPIQEISSSRFERWLEYSG